MEVLAKILVDAPIYISAVVAVLSALIGLFLLIPGEQPEKAMQQVVDFIKRFSKK